VAAQDVAPGLADQHPVHRQHVEAHLQQHVLQRGRRNRDAVGWDRQELLAGSASPGSERLMGAMPGSFAEAAATGEIRLV